MRPAAYTPVLLKHIATLWFVGYLPYAPGTWGTLAGLFFVFIAHLQPLTHIAAIIIVLVVGAVSATAAEKVIGHQDSGHIVIDEFAGFLVSVFLVPQTPVYLVTAFILFRIFDILKPFPIAKLESALSGGIGVVADDVMAGIYANLLLHLLMVLYG